MRHKKKMVSLIFAGMLLFAIILSTSGCSCGATKSSTTASQSVIANTSTTTTTFTAKTSSTTIKTSTTTSQSASNVLVTSSDGSMSLSVPSGWNTNDTSLPGSPAIAVSNNANHEYLIVIERLNSTLPANYTLNDAFTDVKNFSTKIATNQVWQSQSNVTIGGMKGIAVDATGTGTASDTNFAYFATLLQGKNAFYGILGWTDSSLENANESTIDNIVKSFKEMN